MRRAGLNVTHLMSGLHHGPALLEQVVLVGEDQLLLRVRVDGLEDGANGPQDDPEFILAGGLKQRDVIY